MFPIIGLMSGTSMDGINATLVETDGINLNRTNISTILKYQKQTKSMLIHAINNPFNFLRNEKNKKKLNDLIAIDHAKVVKILQNLEMMANP